MDIMSHIIDTHCHLDILEKQGLSIEASMQNAKDAGIETIVQIGIDYETSIRAKEIAGLYTGNGVEVYYTIGCHPADDIGREEIEHITNFLKDNRHDARLVGVGEIGLDYYHKKNFKEQEENFRRFVELSIEYQMPIIVHSRDAAADTLSILESYRGRAFGVIHCFTYDNEYAQKFCDLGYYISFSGIVTFKNALSIQEAAKNIPLEHLLVETDAPFLAPSPHRGKRNESSYTPLVLKKVVDLRHIDPIIAKESIYKNSMKFIQRKAV
jgi:TatD DNase family protein